MGTTSVAMFTGKERDTETGLDSFGARYFSGAQGRFASTDPLDGWAVDPQSWNEYAYARNNPLLYTDPSGMRYTICDTSGDCHEAYSDADFGEKLSRTSKKGVIYDNDGNPHGTDQRTSFEDFSPMWSMLFHETSNRRVASNQMIGTVAGGSAAVGAAVGTGAVVAVIDGVAYSWESLLALGPEVLAKLVAAGKFTQELWAKIQPYVGGGAEVFFGKGRLIERINIVGDWRRIPGRIYPSAEHLPHYHRRFPGPGGSIIRHRPWDAPGVDKTGNPRSWWKRF